MSVQRSILGVDFSGAVLAGEKIWVSRAHWDGKALAFDTLENAIDLPGSAAERDVALPALRQWIGGHTHTACGFDFPFSLEYHEIGDQNYFTWLAKMPERFNDPETFRAAYAGQRRRTDIAAKTPFSPLNHRLFRQTYYGIREVLAPLRASGAQILPFEEPRNGALWLMEICPASLLKKEGLYLSYKGKSASQRENREIIASEMALRTPFLFSEPPFSFSERMRERIIDDTEGDALDAVLAAICTHRALQVPEQVTARDDIEKKEGKVYY